MSEATLTESEPKPEILWDWLEGKPLSELGDEAQLRRELQLLQQHQGQLTRRIEANDQTLRGLNQLLGKWSEQCAEASLEFGEYHPDPYWHGYNHGRAFMCRSQERLLQYLGNIIRLRAITDAEQ